MGDGSGSGKRQSTPPPFDARQSKWLARAMSQGMQAFGSVVEQRFDEVEIRVSLHDEALKLASAETCSAVAAAQEIAQSMTATHMKVNAMQSQLDCNVAEIKEL